MRMGAMPVPVEREGRRRRSCDDAGRAAEGSRGERWGAGKGEHISWLGRHAFIIVRFHANASSSASVARPMLIPDSPSLYLDPERVRAAVPPSHRKLALGHSW